MARERPTRESATPYPQIRLLPLLFLCTFGVFPAPASWEPCGPDDAFDIHKVLVDPHEPRTVYAVGSTGSSEGSLATWRSTDGARSWARVKLGGSARLIAADPARPGKLYGVSPHRLLRSLDAGANWTELGLITSPSSPLTTFALAIDNTSPLTLYAATGHQGMKPTGGVLKSGDGGATWRPAGLSPSIVYDVVLLGGTMYAVGSNGMFQSADGGASWSDIGPGGVTARHMSLAVDRNDPRRMFIATAGEGVFKTADGGASWSASNEGLTWPAVYTIAIDPVRPQIVWAGTSGGGMFRSTDGGDSWHDANEESAAKYTKSLAVAPGDPPTIFVSAGRAGLLRWVED